MLHDKATCNFWRKRRFLRAACSNIVWKTDYSPTKEIKDGACVGVKNTTFTFFRFSCWKATHGSVKRNIFLFREFILETVSTDSLCNPSFSAGYMFCGQLYDISNWMTVSLSPVTDSGSLLVLLELQAIRTVSFSLQFFLPLQISPFKHNVLLSRSLKNSPVSSPLQISYVCNFKYLFLCPFLW